MPDAEILPVDALDYDVLPIHTISFYKVPGAIAAHDEDKHGIFAPREDVQGIHSLTEDGAFVKKARYNPPKPSMKCKHDYKDDDDEKRINKKIKVNTYIKEDASCPNIRKGDEGTFCSRLLMAPTSSSLTLLRIAANSWHRATVSLTTALSSPLLLTREEFPRGAYQIGDSGVAHPTVN